MDEFENFLKTQHMHWFSNMERADWPEFIGAENVTQMLISVIEKYRQLKPKESELVRELRYCLSELHALVWGECPSLLDELSGGDARLDIRIESALDRHDKGGI